ncbi:Gfo/Idh/MocA family oxidoreductase [Sunxiuqinia sp. A32]|uniref:Gfo/Idh/MocA family oxidoreductase n=1 Tax=Sunxiuqinia sp. A32 TaxID=3461496 RepID=UPI004045A609
MKNFALIGAAGYIAERHLKAIKETGNNLQVAFDQFDVMGRIDSYFPNAEFFLNKDTFEYYLKEQRSSNQPVDYTTICSPNFLHAEHIQLALNNQTSAICEKPLVLYPNEIEILEKTEKETGKKVFNVLQLRLHPSIIALREKILNAPKDKIYDVDLTYITSRGKWYFKSWKGDVKKSGGIATNIGIHFFDMLSWIFGEARQSKVHLFEKDKAAGFLQLKNANVRWYLSLDYNDIPNEAKGNGMRTYRSINIENEEIEFSGGFTDLHTQTYQNILSVNGFGIEEAKPCILLTHEIRNSKPLGKIGDFHPLLSN